MDSWWSWLQHGDAKAREKILNKINQKREDISFLAQVGSLCGSKKQEQMAECLLDLLAGQVMHIRLCMVCSACWRKYVAVSDMLAWAALYSRLSGLMLSLEQDSSHGTSQAVSGLSSFFKSWQRITTFTYISLLTDICQSKSNTTK